MFKRLLICGRATLFCRYPCSRQGLPFILCHHNTSWALTPLFSPFPSTFY